MTRCGFRGIHILYGIILLGAWSFTGDRASATATEPPGGPRAHAKGGASAGEWSLGPRILMQTDWRHDEPNRNSSGLAIGLEGPIAVVGRLALSLEVGIDALFREGEVVLANDLVLRMTLETHTPIQPFFGIGPVVLFDVGSESEFYVGGAVTLGVILHATRRWGFILEGAYRLVGGHAFEQQLALSMGPVFFF